MNCLFYVVIHTYIESFPTLQASQYFQTPRNPQIYHKKFIVFCLSHICPLNLGQYATSIRHVGVFFVVSLLLPCENKDSCTSSCCKPITLREGNVVVKNPCLNVEVLSKFLRCVFSVFCKWLTPNNKHLQELDGDKVKTDFNLLQVAWFLFHQEVNTSNGYSPEV